MFPSQRKRKQYESPVRAAAARERRRQIRAVASELFCDQGYAATTMKAIAARADVAERTLYLNFPTKAALLNECIRVAVRGGDEDLPMLERPTWRQALEAAPDQIVARVAEATTDLFSRAARLLAVGEAAARDDPELAEFRDRGHAATRDDALEVARAMKRARVLRARLSVQRAADVLYAAAASEIIYLRLVEECGWSDSEYARALERALAGALTANTPAA
jgi:AcrR family transcriptional regulator